MHESEAFNAAGMERDYLTLLHGPAHTYAILKASKKLSFMLQMA